MLYNIYNAPVYMFFIFDMTRRDMLIYKENREKRKIKPKYTTPESSNFEFGSVVDISKLFECAGGKVYFQKVLSAEFKKIFNLVDGNEELGDSFAPLHSVSNNIMFLINNEFIHSNCVNDPIRNRINYFKTRSVDDNDNIIEYDIISNLILPFDDATSICVHISRDSDVYVTLHNRFLQNVGYDYRNTVWLKDFETKSLGKKFSLADKSRNKFTIVDTLYDNSKHMICCNGKLYNISRIMCALLCGNDIVDSKFYASNTILSELALTNGLDDMFTLDMTDDLYKIEIDLFRFKRMILSLDNKSSKYFKRKNDDDKYINMSNKVSMTSAANCGSCEMTFAKRVYNIDKAYYKLTMGVVAFMYYVLYLHHKYISEHLIVDNLIENIGTFYTINTDTKLIYTISRCKL